MPKQYRPPAPGKQNGGRRPGSGRKKGTKLETMRRRIVSEWASEKGITPLEVMLRAMRLHVESGDLEKAVPIARDAAPYIHPRLAAVAHIPANNNGLDTFSLNELSELRRALQAVEDEARGPLLEHAPQELSADNLDSDADRSWD